MKYRPSVQERARQAVCPECGGPVVRSSPKGRMPVFCSKEHKVSHQNRHVNEGRAMAALVKAWRIDRGSGEIAKEAFSQLCQMVDAFNAADSEAGRPRADLYAAKLMADGRQYMDRREQ